MASLSSQIPSAYPAMWGIPPEAKKTKKDDNNSYVKTSNKFSTTKNYIKVIRTLSRMNSYQGLLFINWVC